MKLTKMNIRCKVKVQTGSINGEAVMTWLEGTITRKLSDSKQFEYEVMVDDRMYFCAPEELWINLNDLTEHIKAVI